MSLRHLGVAFALVLLVGPAVPFGQAPSEVTYLLSFPAPEHRWLAADVRFPNLPAGPLHVRMSSASPGRYARHEFAKNLIEIAFTGANGAAVAVRQREPGHWEVSNHGGVVRVRYRLFGDRVDGTYLGVDSTHAHLNLPATLIWAEGLEDRPARLTLTPPPNGAHWRVATQLFPTADPLVFTAPNRAYLLDSPVEFSPFSLRSFTVPDPATPTYEPTFRVAVHHDAGDVGMTAYTEAIERVVREMVTIFGEFPRFETDTYTFIADYLPSASGDAMEHRNSTVLTAKAGISRPVERAQRLGAAAHEFFHAWNVERIRPRSLEPFDFTAANVSGELWLAEGVTNYYAALVLQRAGLAQLEATLDRFSRVINTATLDPGRQLRSVVEMSRMAPFTDAATAIDPTNFDNTFISYYVWGEAVGLGLDLALRAHSNNRVSLDDYMRALWERFGRPGDAAPGVVDRPYTAADAEAVLGAVAGEDTFADDFFARYIDGREVVDYAALLGPAGISVRPVAPGRATLGDVAFNGARVVRQTPYGSPLYDAGLDRGDVITFLDTTPVASRSDIEWIVRETDPGERIAVSFRRGEETLHSTITLVPDGQIELVAVEAVGGSLSASQRAFRDRWLGSQQ